MCHSQFLFQSYFGLCGSGTNTFAVSSDSKKLIFTSKPINLNYLQTRHIFNFVTSDLHMCASSRGRQGRDPIGPNSPAHFSLRANYRAWRVCVISVLFNINCGQDYFTFIPVPNATFSNVIHTDLQICNKGKKVISSSAASSELDCLVYQNCKGEISTIG